ncbi:hypothetical protein CPS_1140 [Colwellia psychrerythraea 34H]|uniref:Uncharacterized protein n=1 Tax=Colwellia psychrerythraea (strain 34H / ATCC BAA-681) TaxID=167879 RepID=Q486Y2_COLP3|nr:hypothetical protein CPS_1140 [Colwellia psychrerythraea 34H]
MNHQSTFSVNVLALKKYNNEFDLLPPKKWLVYKNVIQRYLFR